MARRTPDEKRTLYLAAPFCRIGLVAEGPALTALFFLSGKTPAETEASPLLRRAARQMEEYFAGRRQRFDLPLNPAGTNFQRRVWAALQEIPFGQTASYGQVAEMAGSPGAARAVGQACGRNPLAILIPCHRVVGHNGSLTGFGSGLGLKTRLLRLENALPQALG